MSAAIIALSLSGGIMLCLALAGFLIVRMFMLSPGAKAKTTQKGPSSTCPSKRKDCAYTTRLNVNGVWGCPLGYEDTGCGWQHGKDRGKLQCRACGPDNPYVAYQETNPNCPDGFRPCNQPPFNYGDLKKNARGEYYYENGWGVDDPNYNEADMSRPYGGTITLNKGKWGGTDAHPELFAKGCCAWGNSADDPERDKANKAIKIATIAVAGAADVAGVALAPFTGGASMAASLALHGASAGINAGGGFIRAKCGGPTEIYKKTKRNYIFKGPYKDGFKMRGTPGIWYTANDGCPMKWIQYIPPNQRGT